MAVLALCLNGCGGGSKCDGDPTGPGCGTATVPVLTMVEATATPNSMLEGDSTTLRARATSTSGTPTVTIEHRGITLTSGPGTVAATIEAVEAGTATARAAQAGAQTLTTSISFAVTPLQAVLTAPDTTTQGDTVLVQASAPPGTDRLYLLTDGLVSDSADGNSATFPWTTDTPGAYSLTVRARNNSSARESSPHTLTAHRMKTPPVVSTVEVRNILYHAAKVRGNIVSDGGAEVTEAGICWSIHADPTRGDNCLIDAGTADEFTIEIKALEVDADYNARAYAVNEIGIAYGENLPFRTLDESTLPVSVDPLMSSEWVIGQWPYNGLLPLYDGEMSIDGRFAAACGPTAFARILGYWGEKIRATGEIDAMTTYQQVRMQVDLDTLVVDYSNLPVSLSESASFEEYVDVAKIFLIASSIGLTNEMDVGNVDDTFIEGLKRHLNVSDGVRFARRWEYSRKDWMALLKSELAHGRPLMIAARTADSPAPWEAGAVAGHWYNIEGYNSEGQFYIDYNLADFRGYFDMDDFGDYGAYGLIVAGFEPGG